MADPLLAAPLDANGFRIYNLPSGPAATDYEKTGAFVYVGYLAADGGWFIYRRTVATNVREYASGDSGYDWSARAGLSYA